MAQQSSKWFLQRGIRIPAHAKLALPPGAKAGKPRRAVAQEFFTNVLELGRYARQQYIDRAERGECVLDLNELREMDDNLAVIEAELAKFK